MNAVTITGLTVECGGRRILDDVGFAVPRGEVVGVIGPNGSGKSTLLSCLYRHTTYRHGEVLVDDRELRTVPRKELARLIAAVPQDTPMAFDMTVEDIVAAGRIPHSSALVQSPRKADREIIDDCLHRVNLDHSSSTSRPTTSTSRTRNSCSS